MLLVASSVGAGGAAAGGNKIHARLTPNEKQNWRALSIQCGCVVRVFVVVAGCARVLLNRLNDDGSTTYLHTYKYRTHTHTYTMLPFSLRRRIRFSFERMYKNVT